MWKSHLPCQKYDSDKATVGHLLFSKTSMPYYAPLRIYYSSSLSAVSADLDLTEPIPAYVPNLPGQKLDGKTSINWDENETVYSGSSGGVYYDSGCANDISSVPVLLYAGNGKEHRNGIHAPSIVDSEIGVNDYESIVKVHRETVW